MMRFLKDPLVHFLVIGAALFAVSAWRGEAIRTGREKIVVTAEQVAQVRDAASSAAGRPRAQRCRGRGARRAHDPRRGAVPRGARARARRERRRGSAPAHREDELPHAGPCGSRAELGSRAPQVLRRRAGALRGSGARDVRSGVLQPGLARRRAYERTPRPRSRSSTRARAPAEVGDRTPLRESYESAPREQVSVLFGDELAEAVFTQPPGRWTGPFQSDFGLHDVRLRARTERRLPPFDEIREQVATEFAAERRRERNEAEYQRMRARYDVVVESPPLRRTLRARPPAKHPRAALRAGRARASRRFRAMRLARTLAVAAAVAARGARARASLEPGVLRPHRDRAGRLRRAVEGVDLGRPRGRARAEGARRLLAHGGRPHLRRQRRRAVPAHDDVVPRRRRRPSVRDGRAVADANGRAAARRLSRRHVVERAPHAEPRRAS